MCMIRYNQRIQKYFHIITWTNTWLIFYNYIVWPWYREQLCHYVNIIMAAVVIKKIHSNNACYHWVTKYWCMIRIILVPNMYNNIHIYVCVWVYDRNFVKYQIKISTSPSILIEIRVLKFVVHDVFEPDIFYDRSSLPRQWRSKDDLVRGADRFQEIWYRYIKFTVWDSDHEFFCVKIKHFRQLIVHN